jgi:hypothetical protein
LQLEALPTVQGHGPYRLFFFSADRDEPPPVHVERDTGSAKFWLPPVRFDRSRGVGRAEIIRIQQIVEENAAILMRAWNEYFEN